MQIQGTLVSTTPLQTSLASDLRGPVEGQTTPTPTTERTASDETPAVETHDLPEEVQGFRQSLEDVFRARLAGSEDRGEGEHEDRERDERHSAARGLREVGRDVRHELKELARELEGPRGSAENREIRGELRQVAKQFGRSMRGIVGDLRQSEEVDVEGVLASVQTSFDDLFSRLGSIFASPEGQGVSSPGVLTLSSTQSLGVELTLTAGANGEEAGAADDAVEVGHVDTPEAELAEHAGAAPEQAPDPTAGFRELLSTLLDRFTSILSDLETRFRPAETEADHEGGEENPTAVGETPTNMRFELAISVYSSIRIEFSGELAGSRVDALS